ncbi:hypothetical protein KSS87_011269 [Heliosperma pusillum]|nr:hypothetical protein KSS87_011269 [Heliosperma pusillum]
MPSPRPPHRNGAERSRSFNGRGGVTAESELRRPRTVPDLRAAASADSGGGFLAKKVLTKVLMNVNMQGSVGAVQVLISLDNTVGDLIIAVVKQYVKDCRRPLLLVKDAVDFDLHYSQFTLECLDREEKLATLGSRNFFMCIEVKGNKPCKVPLKLGYVIHVSQATLGDTKKDKETVIVQVKTSDKKLVMGLLSQDTPQLSFDLVFDEDFEISHNWKNGSIHLMGYLAATGEQYPFKYKLWNCGTFSGLDQSGNSSDEEEEDVPVAKENGQLAASMVKPSAIKPKEEIKPKTVEKDDSDEDDSDGDEDDSDDDSESDEVTDMLDSDNDSEDGDEDDSEEEKPSNATAGKKRPNADANTPQSKKAKLVTPQKTDAKKGSVVHVATPYPTSKSGKTPAGDKTPKSSGSDVSCGSCKKTFKSDSALQSHSKAKHSAK